MSVGGLNQPTGMAFLGPNDFLVTEKATGQVQRVVNGVSAAVLDLAVNSASERGLLGIALHPNFGVNGFVYLYWTESSTGADTTAVDEVPLLGNRVDRFVWNGSALTYDRNADHARCARCSSRRRASPRAATTTAASSASAPTASSTFRRRRGRRGFMQNCRAAPSSLRRPRHGRRPVRRPRARRRPLHRRHPPAQRRRHDARRQPFFELRERAAEREAATTSRRSFAYGIRNSFGMDFDPVGRHLWTQENGDDAFDEINRVEPASTAAGFS